MAGGSSPRATPRSTAASSGPHQCRWSATYRLWKPGSTGPAAVSYAVSKAALHALTVKLAVELRDERILVNAVDPGLTATAPGMEARGARPVADGARSVVTAALAAGDAPTGTFTRDGAPLAW